MLLLSNTIFIMGTILIYRGPSCNCYWSTSPTKITLSGTHSSEEKEQSDSFSFPFSEVCPKAFAVGLTYMTKTKRPNFFPIINNFLFFFLLFSVKFFVEIKYSSHLFFLSNLRRDFFFLSNFLMRIQVQGRSL